MLLCCTKMYAQKITDPVAEQFAKYSMQNLQEKLYLHTDRNFYMAGEIIWYKIYATDAFLNRPLDLSKISYVELLSKEHKPIFQAKISMANASGNGSFQLPYSVGSGNYIIRAYTNWMKNAGPDYFFEKNITIVNGLKKPDWPTTESVKYDIQFFPEGGNLVNGIQSKVAFRIVDSHGKSLECTGVLLNQKNDTILHFKTLHAGMGNFEFTPVAGNLYNASVKTPSGDILTQALPGIFAKGISMHLTETGNNHIKISIQTNTENSTISLLVHTRELLKLAVTKELVGGKTEIDIEKKQLGEGISHFTVFNQQNQPVCERLYFRKPATMLVNAKQDLQQYGTRKKVTVDLSTVDKDAKPVAGDLSMSVYLLDSLQTVGTTSISSYIWLQSDLKGNIESPDYYVTQSGPDVDAAADNLMLTQGWRRFRWEEILGKQKSNTDFLPEIEGHIINGKIVDKRNGRPAENINAYLSVPAEKSLFTTATSNKNGNIQFNVKNFYGGNEIVVQTNHLTDSMYRVDIATPFSEKYSDRAMPEFILSEKQAGTLVNHSIQSQVANTYHAEKQQGFLFPDAIDTLPFYGEPDKRYYLDDYTRFITMEEVVREYVMDVHLKTNSNNKFYYRIWNKSFNDFFQTDPLILIDGVPVFDGDKMVNFDPLKIKRADVMAQKYYQNNLAHDGIINYSTYKGDLAGYQLDANALIMDYDGLQLQREFFSPVYENAEQLNSRLPDWRNLLYWSPDIHTDKGGKTKLSFYTADIPGTYGIVIQGITANGLTGTGMASFTVIK